MYFVQVYSSRFTYSDQYLIGSLCIQRTTNNRILNKGRISDPSESNIFTKKILKEILLILFLSNFRF